jgi:formylglycine-generating enzyme required for sulfatase activity
MMIGQERNSYRVTVAVVVLLSAVTVALGADVPKGLHTFDWATIGDPGNVAYDGEFDLPSDFPGDRFSVGHGSVDYTYRMSKLEVTTGQWLDFVNRFATQSSSPISFLRGRSSGIVGSGPFGNYALNPYVDNAERLPVEVSFVSSMMYANWLHNRTPDDISSLFHGAYQLDFEPGENPTIEQVPLEHEPDAKFWIPTLDEWIKAAHYDPDHDGPGEGGYWRYNTTSDTAPVTGLPGEGETSAGIRILYEEMGEYIDPREIPLGAYPETTSPWGLLDTSGGSQEWTAGLWPVLNQADFRLWGGSGPDVDGTDNDEISLGFRLFANANVSSVLGSSGLRLASAIPAPGAIMVVTIGAVVFHRRR